MATVLDLVFSTVDTIYEPVEITSTPLTITVTNTASDSIGNLGMYITPSTNLGDVDAPGSELPVTDWQDAISWGDISDGAPDEGITLTLPQNSGPDIASRVNSSQGHSFDTKLPFADIPGGGYKQFTVEFNPTGPVRRLYIDLVLEN